MADLLSHMWLPMVIVGLGAAAFTMRILRANLLDELNKPYVVTARAKGVRPWKLVLKYPVRIAINPFISNIGLMLPSLVSGEALVSLVMGLPTIGPLLLQALLNRNVPGREPPDVARHPDGGGHPAIRPAARLVARGIRFE